MAAREVHSSCCCGRGDTHERFAAFVKRAGGSKLAARRMGVTRSYIDMIIARRRCPGIQMAARIQFHAAPIVDIGISAWVNWNPIELGERMRKPLHGQ